MNDKTDSLVQEDTERRRRFLRLFGTAAALLPITAIVGCSDDAAPPASSARPSEPEPQAQQSPAPEPQPAPQPEPEPEPAMDEPMETASESAASGEMPQVSLDDPTAKALGYKHDAGNIDASKYPQYAENQICANCNLYQGAADDEWGGCALFPGKVVNANGWCSGYTPKPA